MDSLDIVETKRLRVQAILDAEKSSEERNRMGQFATPPKLADQILLKAKDILGKKP